MADFHLIPVFHDLQVEGKSTSSSVGEFSGRVVAIAVRGLDPVAAPEPHEDGPAQPEGLLGWGTTHMLVSDPDRPAPIWVAKEDLTGHRIGERQTAGDAR